jgi:hypothetical protein
VFPVRYGLNSYINLLRKSVFKGLMADVPSGLSLTTPQETKNKTNGTKAYITRDEGSCVAVEGQHRPEFCLLFIPFNCVTRRNVLP